MAVEIDHIVPLSEGGAPLDRENLQGLCREHHREKTRAEHRARYARPAES